MRCSKIHYPSEKAAWQKAAALVEFESHRDLKTYYCKFHQAWHLTTAPVQLHDFFWRPNWQWRKTVWNWFQQREIPEIYRNIVGAGEIRIYRRKS